MADVTCLVCGEVFATQEEHDAHHKQAHPEDHASVVQNDVQGPATPEEEKNPT
jgi:hypothetical protein